MAAHLRARNRRCRAPPGSAGSALSRSSGLPPVSLRPAARRRAPRSESPTVSADFALGPAPVSTEAASMQADSHPMDAPTSAPANPSASRPIVVFHVELACLLCGRALGTLQIRQWPSRGPGTLRPIGPTPACQLADWCRLRCLVCGGNIYPDEVEAVRVYPPVQWENERPRRGRPPKWLSEQRRAAAQT